MIPVLAVALVIGFGTDVYLDKRVGLPGWLALPIGFGAFCVVAILGGYATVLAR